MDNLLQSIPVSPMLRHVISACIIVVGTVVGAYIFQWFLGLLARRVTQHTSTDLDDKLLGATRKYVHLLLYLFGGKVLLSYLSSPFGGYVGSGLFEVAGAVVYAAGVIVVSRLIVAAISILLGWYGENIASRTASKVDDEFIPLLDRTIKTVIYILAVLIVLDHFQVDIKGLVAVLGVGSLAVALAAQETIANMIGGFVLMIDRPFRVGDRVRLADGKICIVHEIGIRTTKFRTFDNTLIITPNAELMKSTIHNINYPFPRVRVVVDVGVGYDSDMELVKKVMIDEAEKHPEVIQKPGPWVAFLNFGDSSLDVSLRCWVEDANDHYRCGCQLREQILTRFRKEGIEIPFPQRVVTMIKDTRAGEPESGAAQ
ncbi:MAG: mechanosensitive ion channel family protein [Candidatus Zixiibacteriota bacterium]